MRNLSLILCFILPSFLKTGGPAFTVYEMKILYLLACEDMRTTWYPDGKGHAIGLGYNDWGTKKRRWAIAKYTKGGLTLAEAKEITLAELAKYRTGQKDQFIDLAFRFHIYNTGSCKSINDLKGCCKAKVGCGSPNEDVRKSHNPRRKFEYALATHNWEYVNKKMAEYQKKAAFISSKYK